MKDLKEKLIKILTSQENLEHVEVGSYQHQLEELAEEVLNKCFNSEGKPIDLPAAAKLTRAIITKDRLHWILVTGEDEEWGSTFQVLKMLDEIMDGTYTGPYADRMLGWAQCCICQHSDVKESVFAEINKSCELDLKE